MCVQIHLLPTLSIVLVFYPFCSIKLVSETHMFKKFHFVCQFLIVLPVLRKLLQIYYLMNIGSWQLFIYILLHLLAYLKSSVLFVFHLILAVLHSISIVCQWSVKSFIPPLYFKPFCHSSPKSERVFWWML